MCCKISIETHKLLGESGPSECWEFESIKVIDHNNSSDRKWLMNHQFWAMRNGRRVTMYPESN